MSAVPGAAPPQASGRQIARGAGWMMLFKLADKSVGLVSTLILARLLLPADFGLVALAMAVIAFTQLMGAFGFDSALIQRQDTTRAHFDTAWTFNVIVALAMGVTLAALAVPVASFYDDGRLVGVILVLGAATVVGGFENIGTVAFRKELDFRSEFWLLLFKRMASFAVTIGLAFALRSYWALVVGTVIGRVLGVGISYAVHPFRPRFSLAARGDLLHFSKWIFLSSLIGFFGGRSINFILARTVGAHGLGMYTVAYDIATMPSAELIAPLNRAVFPAYARLAGDLAKLRERFLETFGVICLVSVPVSAGLFGVADAAVHVVLGPNWLETIPMIRIFALCGLAGALQSNLYLVIVAMGRPQANTMLSACLLVITLPVLVWASLEYGVVGAGFAMLFHAAVGLLGIGLVFRHHTRIGGRALLAVAWRPVCASALMVVALTWLDAAVLREWPAIGHLARLLLLMAAGAASYLLAALALWQAAGAPQGAEAMLLRLAKARLSAARTRHA